MSSSASPSFQQPQRPPLPPFPFFRSAHEFIVPLRPDTTPNLPHQSRPVGNTPAVQTFWDNAMANAVGTVIGGIALAIIGTVFWEVAKLLAEAPRVRNRDMARAAMGTILFMFVFTIVVDVSANKQGYYDRGEAPPLLWLAPVVVAAILALLGLPPSSSGRSARRSTRPSRSRQCLSRSRQRSR